MLELKFLDFKSFEFASIFLMLTKFYCMRQTHTSALKNDILHALRGKKHRNLVKCTQRNRKKFHLNRKRTSYAKQGEEDEEEIIK